MATATILHSIIIKNNLLFFCSASIIIRTVILTMFTVEKLNEEEAPNAKQPVGFMGYVCWTVRRMSFKILVSSILLKHSNSWKLAVVHKCNAERIVTC